MFLNRQPPQIEQIGDISEHIVIYSCVLLETLQVQIKVESLLSADETRRIFILIDFLFLLAQLRELVKDSPSKYLEDYFLYEDKVGQFTQ